MEFKKITNKNLWDVVNLQVKANQNTYIATNTVSLLESYATQNENERVETSNKTNSLKRVISFDQLKEIWLFKHYIIL